MSGLPGPLKRLDAKQKALLIVAVLIIIVAVASIESRGGLDLTNPGLTVPPIATSSTTTTSMPTTTLAPVTTTAPTAGGIEPQPNPR